MLTPEQRKLVEDNHNIIYYVLNKYGFDKEEYYGSAAVAMCKAAELWNPEKSNFITYAYRAIINAVLMDKRKHKRSYSKDISYNIPLPDSFEDTDLEYLDLIDDNNDYMLEWMTLCDLKDQARKHSSPHAVRILELKLAGYNQSEIADIVGISQPQVSRILNYIK